MAAMERDDELCCAAYPDCYCSSGDFEAPTKSQGKKRSASAPPSADRASSSSSSVVHHMPRCQGYPEIFTASLAFAVGLGRGRVRYV